MNFYGKGPLFLERVTYGGLPGGLSGEACLYRIEEHVQMRVCSRDVNVLVPFSTGCILYIWWAVWGRMWGEDDGIILFTTLRYVQTMVCKV